MKDKKSFYNNLPSDVNAKVADMECFAILYIAKMFNKEAACILTVVDSENQVDDIISAEDRQNSMDNMEILALESI